MPRITSIQPSPANPRRVSVRVDDRPAVTLSAKLALQLGIAVGDEWTDELAAKVRGEAEFDRVLSWAGKLIGKKPLSRSRMTQKLHERGIDEAMQARVLDRLTQLKLLDDETLARLLIDELTQKHSAGPAMLRAKLLERGLDESLVEQLIEESVGAGDPLRQARELAKKKLASLARLDAKTRARRLAGLLARKGYDEEIVAQVVEELAPRDDDRGE